MPTRQKGILTVDLGRRLPDIEQTSELPEDLDEFGRFALLRSGAFWFGDIHSSHPPATEHGYYWALAGDRLFISPQGSTYKWKEAITAEVIREIAQRLSLKRYYDRFRIEEGDLSGAF
ncbi:MAG: hypothetical protein ACLFP4_15670 [Spirochaetales bacterium]